ncbi:MULTISPECIES: hypothetical protein [unclassified Nonomuraea]|uniref:hypothetical protein n=1 Tax=unclassified Nonomuraea TaxID=2593643 RepID=UPI0033FF876B
MGAVHDRAGGGHRWDGKLLTLAAFLIRRHRELEADLARFYPRDADQLPEFWAGRMSWRRLAVLVENLPPEAVTTQLEDQAGVTRWTQDTELQAAVVDELRTWRWEYAMSNSPKNAAKPPRPDPFPRPEGVEPRG